MELIDKFNRIVVAISPDQPLADEAMEIMVMVLMGGGNPVFSELATSNHEILQEMPQAKAFMLRLERLTEIKITVGALLMIATNIESFGDATMYAYYLHRRCNPNVIITTDVLSTKIFPWGMLSREQRNKMWAAQKISKEINREEIGGAVGLGADNLLDYAGVCESKITV